LLNINDCFFLDSECEKEPVAGTDLNSKVESSLTFSGSMCSW
jgi:hypothetical protein